MNNQNSELKTNEKSSEESNSYSEEEKEQIISEALKICAEALIGLRQDVSTLRSEFSHSNQKH